MLQSVGFVWSDIYFLNMDITERAREIFSHDLFATEATGIAIEHVGEHESRCSLRVGEKHCNARGVVMGGVLYTLGDFAAAVAVNMNTLQWVSLDATMHYLAAVPLGATLVATAKAIKHGRTTALYQTIIENPDNGKCIAIVETTMIKV